MSEIKLAAGQIWEGKRGDVRQILFIGNNKVFYRNLTANSFEDSVGIEYFKSEHVLKLLPCWPEKQKVKRAQALLRGPYIPFVSNYWFKDEDDVQQFSGSKIIEFPLNGVWKEFDE